MIKAMIMQMKVSEGHSFTQQSSSKKIESIIDALLSKPIDRELSKVYWML